MIDWLPFECSMSVQVFEQHGTRIPEALVAIDDVARYASFTYQRIYEEIHKANSRGIISCRPSRCAVWSSSTGLHSAFECSRGHCGP